MLRALMVTALSLAVVVPADAKGHGNGRKNGHRKHGRGHHTRVIHVQEHRVVRPVTRVRYVERRVLPRRYVIGQRLPTTIYDRPLETWRVARYAPAPVGYRYVAVDDDVLLINVTSRLISNVLLDALR